MKTASDTPLAPFRPAPGNADGSRTDCTRDRARERFRLTFALLVLIVFPAQPIFVRSAHAQGVLAPGNAAKLEAAAVSLYDDVEHEDWAGAMRELQQISKAAERVITSLDASSAPLTRAIIHAARAVHQHDRGGGLHAANRIREWADLEIASDGDDIPLELARLRYAVRELQIESAMESPRRMAARLAEVRRCWEKLKSAAEQTGDPATMTAGEARVRSLEGAADQAALREVLTPFSDWVEKLDIKLDGPKP